MANISSTGSPNLDTSKLLDIVPPIYAGELSKTMLNLSLAQVQQILQTGTPPPGSGITAADIQALGDVRTKMIQLVRWMTSGEYWTPGNP